MIIRRKRTRGNCPRYQSRPLKYWLSKKCTSFFFADLMRGWLVRWSYKDVVPPRCVPMMMNVGIARTMRSRLSGNRSAIVRRTVVPKSV